MSVNLNINLSIIALFTLICVCEPSIASSNRSLPISFNFINVQVPQTPIVLWHGIGDSCCGRINSPKHGRISTGNMMAMIKKHLPQNTYVYSICQSKVGDFLGCLYVQDVKAGFYGDANEQINMQCEHLMKDKKLENGFHLMGMSQGGLFARALVQKCPGLKIKNLISFGGPQNGVAAFPGCETMDQRRRLGRNGKTKRDANTILDLDLNVKSSSFCRKVDSYIKSNAYTSWVQRNIIPGQYYTGSTLLEHSNFHSVNNFLTDINMVRKIDKQQIENLHKIGNGKGKFILLKFDKDDVISPKESQWFGYVDFEKVVVQSKDKDGQDYTEYKFEKIMKKAEDLPIYKNLGLDVLEKEGRLHFLSIDRPHIIFEEEWFLSEIVDKYLR